VCRDPALFGDDTVTNYAAIGVPTPASNGYIRDVQHETLGDVPADVSGNSSTAFADYQYRDTGWREALVGGGAGVGAFAGPSCVRASISSGTRTRGLGGRLALV